MEDGGVGAAQAGDTEAAREGFVLGVKAGQGVGGETAGGGGEALGAVDAGEGT